MGRLVVRDDVGSPVYDDEAWAAEALAPTPPGSFELYYRTGGPGRRHKLLWAIYPTRELAEAAAKRHGRRFEVVEPRYYLQCRSPHHDWQDVSGYATRAKAEERAACCREVPDREGYEWRVVDYGQPGDRDCGAVK